MIINFSNSHAELESCFTKYILTDDDDPYLIDLADLNFEKRAFHKVDLRELNEYENIYNSSLEEYKKIAGLRSWHFFKKKPIRSLNFNSFPVYWFTEMGIKHSYYEISLRLIIFKNLISSLASHLNSSKNIYVVIPSRFRDYSFNIEDVLSEHITKIRFHFQYIYKPSTREYISHLKNFYKKALALKKTIKGKGKLVATQQKGKVNYIFASVSNITTSSDTVDYVMDGIYNYSKELQVDTVYLPYIASVNDVEYWKGDWESSYVDSFPSKMQIMSFLFDLFRIHIKSESKEINVDAKLIVNDIIISSQIRDLIVNSDLLLFNLIWHRNFFKKIKCRSSVFYQDEFYLPGRLLSSAAILAKNNKITTYGVQHSLLFKNHTVYTISQKELDSYSGNKGIPIPDYFITWNKECSDFFLGNNNLDNNYTIPAGHLKQYYLLKKFLELDKPAKKENIYRILWCTGLKKSTLTEFNIIKDAIGKCEKSLVITVRMHPLHNIKDFIMGLFSDFDRREMIKFSTNTDVIFDLNQSDIVLSAASSGIIMESLTLGINTVSIYRSDYQTLDYQYDLVYNVRNAEEFEKALESIIGEEKAEKLRTNTSHTIVDINRWNKILLN